VTNAKFAAPWYYTEDEQEEEQQQDSEPKEDEKGVATNTAQVGGPWITASSPPSEDVMLSGDFQDLTISSSSEVSPKKEPQVRYMLDYTLNRFCRWLRILGLDAALETEEEEKLRTKECKL
jgi:hypothetical protein